MWPTVDGLRTLVGDEAKLVRGSVGIMLDHLAAEGDRDQEPYPYGIEWFDPWDRSQRIWLLDQVSHALFTDASPPPPAAIYEATVDAIFHQIIDLVTGELDDAKPLTESSWRQCVIDAFATQHKKLPDIRADETDIRQWQTVITQIADSILGVRLYQKAESFRDRDIQQTQAFLTAKGLPDDFLQKIPPLQTIQQTQNSINRIQSIK